MKCTKASYTNKIIALISFLVLLIVLVPTRAFAVGNYGVDLSSPAYQSSANPFYASGYGGNSDDGYDGECTWYAWGRAYEKLGISLPCRKNANDWADEARNAGYIVGTEARANSIMVEHYAGTGHVFFVESVDNGYAYVTEGNWLGYYHEDAINLSTMRREAWRSQPMGSIEYIYLADAPRTPSNNWNTSNDPTLPDGDYIIVAMADPHYFLDISGAEYPAAPGTNVHLWYTPDGKVSDCDAWTVRYENGYYRISQRGQNVSLDVDNESAQNGANVQVWINNDFSAQKWTIIGNSSVGYRVKALCSSKSLEYENSILANGTNVQQWADDDVPGQYWMFIPYSNQSDATNTKPVVTLPNVLFEPWNDDRFTYIGETDASIGQRIVIENGTCTEVGMILYDTDGVQKGSAKNLSYEHEKNYFKINEEMGVGLWPGTNYQYKFYAVVDGKTVYGSMGSFTTKPSSHDHSFVWTTAYAPTCVDSGFAVGECVICGFRQIEDLVALGHDYVNGVCTRCGHTLVTIGHMHSYNWTTIQEASCTESGYKVGHCALCGDEVTNEVPALGHSYVNGVCTRCGEQQASNSGAVLVKPITPSMFSKDDQGQSSEAPGDTVTIIAKVDPQSGYSLPRSDADDIKVTSNGENTTTNKFTLPAGALIKLG